MLRIDNRWLSLEACDAGTLDVDAFPRYVLVELTQACPLACTMCRGRPSSGPHLPAALWEKVKPLFATASIVDLRGQGESFLVQDLPAKIRDVHAAGARPRILTSGALYRPEVLDALLDTNAIVGVSIESTDPDVYKTIRGDVFDAAKVTIQYLSEGIRKGSQASFCALLTVVRTGVPTLERTIEDLLSWGVPEVCIGPVRHTNPSINLDGLRVPKAILREGVRVMQHIPGLPRAASWEMECLKPLDYFVLLATGKITYCDHILDGTEIIGDLNTQTATEIWTSPLMEAVRYRHRERERVDILERCADCYENRYIEFEDRIDPRRLPVLGHHLNRGKRP